MYVFYEYGVGDKCEWFRFVTDPVFVWFIALLVVSVVVLRS